MKAIIGSLPFKIRMVLGVVVCICATAGCGRSGQVAKSKLIGDWERATEYRNDMGLGFYPGEPILEGRHVITPDATDDEGVGITFLRRFTEFTLHFSADDSVQITVETNEYKGTYMVAKGVLNLALADSQGNQYSEKWPYKFVTVDGLELLSLIVYYNKLESTKKVGDGYEIAADGRYGSKKLTLMSESLPFRKTR